MFNQENYMRLLVVIGIATFVIIVVLSGGNIKETPLLQLMRTGSSATLVPLLFHFAFKKWIWKTRIPLLNPFIVKVPNLHGTWKGKLQSNWVDPNTGSILLPIEVTIYIRQTFSTISVEVQTNQMTSTSYLAGFKIDNETNTMELCYSYTSRATMATVQVNPWHDGTTKLQVHNGSQLKLIGDYWTSRQTTGTLELYRVSTHIDR